VVGSRRKRPSYVTVVGRRKKSPSGVTMSGRLDRVPGISTHNLFQDLKKTFSYKVTKCLIAISGYIMENVLKGKAVVIEGPLACIGARAKWFLLGGSTCDI
jgi:hypothetical protein